MLTAVKNQVKVALLSIKYSILRAMVNKTSFLFSVVLMFLSNASFLIQWVVILSVSSSDISMKQVMLIWAINAGAFGLHSVLFDGIKKLPEYIINGGLDAYLVQPKNILISVATSSTSMSAFGDLLYGIVVLIIASPRIESLILFIILIILGAIIFSSFSIIWNSLIFFSVSFRDVAEIMYRLPISFSTYPDTIFSGAIKILMYTVLPIGFIVYLPVKAIFTNSIITVLIIFLFAIIITIIAFIVFYIGLKKYTSSNLMDSRV